MILCNGFQNIYKKFSFSFISNIIINKKYIKNLKYEEFLKWLNSFPEKKWK
jgi:hypothetical protein